MNLQQAKEEQNIGRLNLRRIRENRNMSQLELAAAMNVGQSAVSQWETGESRPTYNNLIKLTRILKCSLAELVGSEQTSA